MREEEVKKTCLTSRTRWKDVLQWPVPMIQKKTGLPGDPLDAVVILYNNSKFQT